MSKQLDFNRDNISPETVSGKNLQKQSLSYFDDHSQATLISLFRKQAIRAPEHLAIAFKTQELTYRELDEKSDWVAAQLLANGTEPGDLIPVWMERSVDWVIAILGILKAGAAYVPIDPHYPSKRVHFIVEDTKAKVLLTKQTLGKELEVEHTRIFYMDTLQTIENQAPDHTDIIPVTPDMLAYVIYTSGSTGTPKGVMVQHRAIEHLVTWHNERFEVDDTCRLTLVAGLAFDISVWEVWSALLSGATLYIADEQERIDSEALWQYFRAHKITHGFVPTVLVPAIVECSKKSPSPALRYLFTGGEQLSPVYTSGLSYTLIDYYGPTEYTVFATYRTVQEENGQYLSSIGRPIAHTRAYIVDKKGQLLPPGIKGQLFLGGAGLSSGYLNNEVLTHEKFINLPFAPGETLYDTGDLVCWLPDGNLQFFGRKDHQLKIRGFRVEPGEIEQRLLKIPGIRQAVVLGKENKIGNKYLLAFIAFEATHISNGDIQSFLREELPEYMIPGHFITIDSIPLTTNGKTDHDNLLQRAEKQVQEIHLSDPPTTHTECVIAEIWCEDLELTAINASDNFFDIGGDSILVAIVITGIERKLGVKVYVRDIYQYPTIRELAEALQQRKSEAMTLPEEDMEPYIELQQDVYLNPDTVIASDYDPQSLLHQRHILLTGATGFVGIHLLHDLLRDHTEAMIYVLIRAHDTEQALEKLKDTLSNYDLYIPATAWQRIVPIPGDFNKEKLGINPKDYAFLSENMDVIYHSGSSVNFIEPYSYMKSPNVEGLRSIIDLAANKRTKCLVLLSTISVYSWGHVFTGKTVMEEGDDISQNLQSVSRDIGYVRSKWVMEAIADLAADQGLPVITYRLGYAMCNSKTGACAPYQWWAGLMKTCLRSGSYPALTELREGLITVDYMTRAITHISKNPNAIGKKFNLIASPETNLTLEDFFERINHYYGLKLQPQTYKQWRKQWENDTANPLYPLTSLFKDNMYKGLSTVELYQDTYIWDCQNVTDFLKGSGIEEPVFDRIILDKYLNFLNLYPEQID